MLTVVVAAAVGAVYTVMGWEMQKVAAEEEARAVLMVARDGVVVQ